MVWCKMRKRDLKFVDHLARKFNVDRGILSELIHDIKSGVDGNPNLQFDRIGNIYVGNENMGRIYDLTR